MCITLRTNVHYIQNKYALHSERMCITLRANVYYIQNKCVLHSGRICVTFELISKPINKEEYILRK
jgi:hypothetical protein